MSHSAWKTTLLAALFAVPSAALLTAQPEPPPPPDPPRAVPPPPEAPEPPEPPVPPRERHQRIVVDSPEQDIVVDGDRLLIDGEEFDPERFADLGAFDGAPFAWKSPERANGFIGIKPVEMTPELRQHFGAPKDAGVFVGSVEKDGPAAKAGLQVGDIVTKVDGDSMASSRELVRAVRHRRPGETIQVEVLRQRTSKTIPVTVAGRKEPELRVGEWNSRDGGGGWSWDRDWNRNWSREWNQGWKRERPAPSEYPRLEKRLEKRLEELEQKLSDLEDRLPSR